MKSSTDRATPEVKNKDIHPSETIASDSSVCSLYFSKKLCDLRDIYVLSFLRRCKGSANHLTAVNR